jgi:phosphatidylglycerol---prolipoprotein diacylglyceryl transferase
VLFEISLLGRDIPVYGFGLMLVIGLLAAAYLARHLGRRSGLDGEIFINAALLALATGIVGARLSHILENPSEFARADLSAWDNLRNMAMLQSGGLTYYGGFLLAFPILVLYGRYRKVPIRTGMDIVAPCLMLGLAFGRLGCFLNGCCFGSASSLPWALQFPDHLHPAHPAQLYSAISAFLLTAVLLACFTLPHIPGRVFALMLMLEGTTRFLLELLRAEPPINRLGMSLGMVLAPSLALLGLLLWRLFPHLPPTPCRPPA